MNSHYTRTAIFLHWLLAILLLGQFAFGWYLSGIPRGVPARGYTVNLHKSTGIVIGLLIVARLVWRLTHRPPPLPATLPGWQRRAAAVSHRLLYLLMLALPLSGYVASNFSKHGVLFFNTLKLAPWGRDDPRLYAFFNGAHHLAGWLLLALVIVHVLAALKHRFLDRDQVFARMAPPRPAGRERPAARIVSRARR